MRDIAAVAARVLAEPQRHAGRTYTPTGPESVSLYGAAEEIGHALGRPVRYVPQSPQQTRDALRAMGLDEWMAEALAEYRVAYGSGWGDFTNDHVATVVGRQPRDLAAFVRDHRHQLAS